MIIIEKLSNVTLLIYEMIFLLFNMIMIREINLLLLNFGILNRKINDFRNEESEEKLINKNRKGDFQLLEIFKNEIFRQSSNVRIFRSISNCIK